MVSNLTKLLQTISTKKNKKNKNSYTITLTLTVIGAGGWERFSLKKIHRNDVDVKR